MLGGMAEPVPSQYDAFAGGYAAFAETAPYNALYDRPATLDLIGEVDGLRVLDAACGARLLRGGAAGSGRFGGGVRRFGVDGRARP